jgi:hypothetical protein
VTATLLTTIGSALAGSAIAAVGIIGLVSSQTAAPDTSPTNANQPVVVDYGDN